MEPSSHTAFEVSLAGRAAFVAVQRSGVEVPGQVPEAGVDLLGLSEAPLLRPAQGVPAVVARPLLPARIAGATPPAAGTRLVALPRREVPAGLGPDAASGSGVQDRLRRPIGDADSEISRAGAAGGWVSEVPVKGPARLRQARGNRSVETTLRVRVTGSLRPGMSDAPP